MQKFSTIVRSLAIEKKNLALSFAFTAVASDVGQAQVQWAQQAVEGWSRSLMPALQGSWRHRSPTAPGVRRQLNPVEVVEVGSPAKTRWALFAHSLVVEWAKFEAMGEYGAGSLPLDPNLPVVAV